VVDGLAEGRFELRHPGKREPAVLPLEIDVGGADAETERRVRSARLDDAGVSQREGGPNRRVAGKWRFGGAGEDADAMIGARLLRRKHERALGKVRLARQPLHRVRIEPRRLNEHEQLVALQPAIREHSEVYVL